MMLSLMVAMTPDRVIGKNNQLPWHLPADLQHFKRTTMGKPIIMGRKTFESIGRPLPGRHNIVLSHDKTFQADGCTCFHSLEAALKSQQEQEEIFIIGGAQLFAQTLPKAHYLYMTLIHADISGDTYFPAYNVSEWQTVSRVDHSPDEKNKYAYSFIKLKRHG